MKKFIAIVFTAFVIFGHHGFAQTNEITFQNYFEKPIDEQNKYYNTTIVPTVGFYFLDGYKKKTKVLGVELGYGSAIPLADTVIAETANGPEKRSYSKKTTLNLNFQTGSEYEIVSRLRITYGALLSLRFVRYNYSYQNTGLNNSGQADVAQTRVAVVPKLGLKARIFKKVYIGVETVLALSIGAGDPDEKNLLNAHAGLNPALSVKF